MAEIADWQQAFLREQRLPAAYLDSATRFFGPIAERLAQRARERGEMLLVGVNGCQGSGKSTACAYIARALGERHGLSAVSLSLDDFYLTRAEREVLAERVHPLFATRGVPGTHDIGLIESTLRSLREAGSRETAVPAFNKAADDRAPEADWPRVHGPVHVVLLEGWCLGAHAQNRDQLMTPVNALESNEDAEGRWRAYSNEQLHTRYEPFYARIDLWVMLRAPGFEQVLRWRSEQERKLREAVGNTGSGLMDDDALRRFVAHFERYTRQCLSDLPGKVDICLALDEERRIIHAHGLEQTLG